MSRRKRGLQEATLTATVDQDLIEAGQEVVEAGQAESVSGWVSAALEDKVRRDRKLALLAASIVDYESELGEITSEDIVAQQCADREEAMVGRGKRRKR